MSLGILWILGFGKFSRVLAQKCHVLRGLWKPLGTKFSLTPGPTVLVCEWPANWMGGHFSPHRSNCSAFSNSALIPMLFAAIMCHTANSSGINVNIICRSKGIPLSCSIHQCPHIVKCYRKHFIAHKLPKLFLLCGPCMLCVPRNEILVNTGALININFV